MTEEEKKFIEEKVQRRNPPRVSSVKSDFKDRLFIKKNEEFNTSKKEQTIKVKKKHKVQQKDVVRYFK